ncbi:rhomboid family intramembrane serine protease [Sphingomonas sp. R-74633]|uniref:rhomboid family intramembrane serine protease n=1 Tax=Sphingomonas sp. R-74633 TaxID=2751188 RepID=UPI0015D3D90B|nr:rhomboid family intramembrane serine protease [Sphingomonas sp. R-74633]NYT39150.1 rhomboid family intramembrane serine protease [Sphingomonas sp. R-74633]
MFSQSAPEHDAETDEALFRIGWHVPWQSKILPYALAGIMAALWIFYDLFRNGMSDWGVSGRALAQGRFETIPLHMFAHAGIWHIVMNATALCGVSPPLIALMGRWPESWLRYLALFVASGLAGMAMYLAIHPLGTTPMLGASGAICGLLGLLIRLEASGAALVAVRSRKVWLAVKGLVQQNLVLIALITLPALLSGRAGGIAWEAHLGGFLFGLLVGPHLLSATPPMPLPEEE